MEFWRRYAPKQFLHFRSQWPWPLTFRPQICSHSYYCPAQRHDSVKSEVSTAFLFRENRRHGMDGQTDWRGCKHLEHLQLLDPEYGSLPSHLKEADLSYNRFRRPLNTFLFGQWGHGAVWTISIMSFEITLPTYSLAYLMRPPGTRSAA